MGNPSDRFYVQQKPVLKIRPTNVQQAYTELQMHEDQKAHLRSSISEIEDKILTFQEQRGRLAERLQALIMLDDQKKAAVTRAEQRQTDEHQAKLNEIEEKRKELAELMSELGLESSHK